jgi:hypothetical protein
MLRSTLSANAEDQCAGSARPFETPSDKLKKKSVATVVKEMTVEAFNRHLIYQLITVQRPGMPVPIADDKNSVKPSNNTPQAYAPTIHPRLRLSQSTTPTLSPIPFMAPLADTATNIELPGPYSSRLAARSGRGPRTRHKDQRASRRGSPDPESYINGGPKVLSGKGQDHLEN